MPCIRQTCALVRVLTCAGNGCVLCPFSTHRRDCPHNFLYFDEKVLGGRDLELVLGKHMWADTGMNASPTTATYSAQDLEELAVLLATIKLTNRGQGSGDREPETNCCIR